MKTSIELLTSFDSNQELAVLEILRVIDEKAVIIKKMNNDQLIDLVNLISYKVGVVSNE